MKNRGLLNLVSRLGSHMLNKVLATFWVFLILVDLYIEAINRVKGLASVEAILLRLI